MKTLTAAALILALSTTAAFASTQYDAKKELEGWSRAAARYEQECHAGKLRQQMPKEDAVAAYDCFAKIIDEEVTFQYPDLYEILNEKMKEAHEGYGNGTLNWEATLVRLQQASDEYNAAVEKRNQKTGND